MIRAAVLLMLLAGCGAPGRIEVTLNTDSTVSDAQLASARILRVGGNGAVGFNQDVPLDAGRGLLRTERLLVEIGPGSGEETLAFTAIDGAGVAFACNSGDFVNLANPRLTVTMHAGGCVEPPDMAAPGDGPDLAVPADLSGLDMGPFVGGASQCPVAGALLCEGWEAGPYPGFWNFGNMPRPTVDTTTAARGTHALHMALPAVASGYQAIGAGEQMTFPHAPPIYVRTFVYLEPPRINFVATLLRLDQSAGSNAALNLALQPNGAIMVDSTNISPGFVRTSSTTVIPLNKWTCIELMYDGITNGNEKLWVDDVEVTDVEGSGINATAAFDEMVLFYDYDATGPVPATSLWYDEVVVSATRVGCTN